MHPLTAIIILVAVVVCLMCIALWINGGFPEAPGVGD